MRNNRLTSRNDGKPANGNGGVTLLEEPVSLKKNLIPAEEVRAKPVLQPCHGRAIETDARCKTVRIHDANRRRPDEVSAERRKLGVKLMLKPVYQNDRFSLYRIPPLT